MLDIKLIREKPEFVKQALASKGIDAPISLILELDEKRRHLTLEGDQKKAERNQISKTISVLKREGKDASAIIASTNELGEALDVLEKDIRETEQKLDDILLSLPNLPHTTVPLGRSSRDNVVVRSWGDLPQLNFTPIDHLALGEKLGLFDFARGAKITGRGFPIYIGRGARLERALIDFFLDHHLQNGFTEILPPLLVNKDSMIGTGQLPKMAEDMYKLAEDDYYLIPTAEVPVTNYHAREMLNAADLPLRYAAYSACFRREAGSWGKETRGFQRLHQFNKVEMVCFSDPEKSYEEHERLVNQAEGILQKLEIPYRVLALCTGDLSFAAAKCYDLEVYSPYAQGWLEVSSVSNFEDFQARRASIRFKKEGKPQFVHTLNGSGLATPRLLVALLECHQTAEGTLRIPPALQPYLGGIKEFT